MVLGIVLGSILAVFLLIFGIYLMVLHNKLVKAKNKVKESLSSVDVYLKMRFDLVPNLVETVKAYAKHERSALEEIVKIRASIQNAKDDQEIIERSNEGLPVLKGIFALNERYPELKSDKAFRQLQKSLEEIEESISASRRFYNANITSYNNLVGVFPNKMFAKMFNHKPMEFFSIKLGEEVVPAVFDKPTKSKKTSKQSAVKKPKKKEKGNAK